MKIVVYAISKNESKFVNRWVDSLSEADDIYVLDTGSTDNTVELLKKRDVHVESININPFRFDVARNKSLELVPTDVDICVCLDLDEVIKPGWRQKIEDLWDNDTTRLRYNYNWSLDENNLPIVNFYIEKIHKRLGYKWINPVHEVLSYNGEEKTTTTDLITVNHYPDANKPRSSYLPLLELAVKEDPTNDRNMHYLGREYMYYKRYNECIDTLIKHLGLKTATWKDERSASMRFIARSYKNMNRYNEAKMWLKMAIKETPYLRDPYVELAILEYKKNNWNEVIKNCNDALKIKNHEKTYINEPFSWDSTIYDILSIAYFNIGNYNKALENVNTAIQMNPCDRLLNNKLIIKEFVDEDINL